MTSSNIGRWAGLATMVGGALWVVVFAIYALRSSGPGLEPPYRSFEGLGIPAVVSLLLIVVGLVALHTLQRRSYGGIVGLILALVGATVVVLTGASWPVGMAGGLAFMLGSLLVGAALLVTNALPRWGAVALIVGSGVFFLFNTETAQAWFALPYGVAWIAVGYLLWSGGGGAAQRHPRVR